MKKTWGAVKSECLNLGFERARAYQKNPNIFIESVNRAMVRVASYVKPILGKYVISQRLIQNVLPAPLRQLDIQPYRGIPLTFAGSNIKAYYFECDGVGECTVSNGVDPDVVIALDSDKRFKAYRGFMNGDVTLTFSGDWAYNIRNVALYREIVSNKVEDIPSFSQYVPYDIAELTKEGERVVFMDFANEQPLQEGNFSDGAVYRTVADYKKQGRNVILLNHFDVGEFTVWYKKYPTLVSAVTPDNFPLDLDYDAADLVPLLASYYIWLDDDPQRATMYHNAFVDRAGEIMGAASKEPTLSEYENTTGWW